MSTTTASIPLHLADRDRAARLLHEARVRGLTIRPMLDVIADDRESYWLVESFSGRRADPTEHVVVIEERGGGVLASCECEWSTFKQSACTHACLAAWTAGCWPFADQVVCPLCGTSYDTAEAVLRHIGLVHVPSVRRQVAVRGNPLLRKESA